MLRLLLAGVLAICILSGAPEHAEAQASSVLESNTANSLNVVAPPTEQNAEQTEQARGGPWFTLTPDDRLTIARFIAVPFFLWAFYNVASYSLTRYHTLRTLYVDIAYRMLYTRGSVERLDKWITDVNTDAGVSYLHSDREEHVVYPAMQDALRSTLWGLEKETVRILYRDLGEIEVRAGRAASLYHALIDKQNCANSQEFEGITANYERMKELCEFWEQYSARERSYKWKDRFFGLPRILLYSRVVAYGLSVVWPLGVFLMCALALVFVDIESQFNALWMGNAKTEALVGLSWLEVGVGLGLWMAFQSRRMRRVIDDRMSRSM